MICRTIAHMLAFGILASINGAAIAQNDSQPDLPTSPTVDFTSLLRPRFVLSAQWQPEVDSIAMSSYDFSIQMPTYLFWGRPRPSLPQVIPSHKLTPQMRLICHKSCMSFRLECLGCGRLTIVGWRDS